MRIKDTYTRELPPDPNETNVPRQVKSACFSHVQPKRFENAEMIHVNEKLKGELGLNELNDFSALMSGQKNFEGMKPYAMCYGGHQFGNWAGQLGDGRAINIAELEHGNKRWFLQLKGAGPTPYSRSADGLAVLRSSVREYLMSWAIQHLNVPTTQALSLMLSGDEVLRDILYNGNPAYEKGAIVCRVAPSFLRFGNYEIFTARGDHENLKKLVDYTIKQFYADLGAPSKEVYVAFFKEVVNRSLHMVLDWQRVGFVHGVMNTDNMSILGLTIDYGPYGWLENYDPGWTPNTTDAQHKRYRFGNQPSIVLWNLTQLANTLYPLIEEVAPLQEILDNFRTDFQEKYLEMMLAKIGLYNVFSDDSNLIHQLTENLRLSEVDMTLFFRNLVKFNSEDAESHLEQIKKDSYSADSDFQKRAYNWKIWLNQYAARLKSDPTSSELRIEKMKNTNPKYVLRNYMAHLAIESAKEGDYTVLNELFDLLKLPYDEQPEMEKWFVKRPDWATEKVGCSMLSCSS